MIVLATGAPFTFTGCHAGVGIGPFRSANVTRPSAAHLSQHALAIGVVARDRRDAAMGRHGRAITFPSERSASRLPICEKVRSPGILGAARTADFCAHPWRKLGFRSHSGLCSAHKPLSFVHADAAGWPGLRQRFLNVLWRRVL